MHQEPIPVVLAEGAVMPRRAHPGDAGLDLCAAEDSELAPHARALVGTGVRLALPEGTVGMVCPRSGLAVSHGITVLNSPGIVDAGYRGELRVALVNTDPRESFRIRRGDRIAQLVLMRHGTDPLVQVDALEESVRGEGGFGSSGGFGTSTTEEG